MKRDNNANSQTCSPQYCSSKTPSPPPPRINPITSFCSHDPSLSQHCHNARINSSGSAATANGAAVPADVSPLRTPSPSPSPSPSRPPISLQQPSKKSKPSKPRKVYRRVRSLFRSFPIITPCKVPVGLNSNKPQNGHIHGGTRMTGTLYGHRKARVHLAIQENPRCLPMLILELGVPTGKLLQEMGTGLTRITLECEKQTVEKKKLIEEPIWTMYCNGRKAGYGKKKEPTEEDLNVMQMLHTVSMGAGVLPTENTDMPDGELTYMRAHFERVIGSKDSETFYVMNPDGNSGPELSIFFVRI